MLKYNKIFLTIAAIAVVTSFVFIGSGCKNNDPAQATDQPHQRAVQVDVAEVTTTFIRKEIELPGRISARRIAQVRARVAGIVLSRDFKEGSHVEKGQPLFHIDPAQFNAALSLAKADLAKAEANMVDLAATADRYSKLIKTNSISQSEYDTAINSYRAAKASKDAAEAAVKTASLSLSYATVEAPISGRIGRAFITEGALVGEGEATHLATIQQLNPIYADINEPVSEYLKLKATMNKAVHDENATDVTVSVDNVDYVAKGKLLFSDVTVDQKSGQVSLRSEFPNDDGMLLPGMFVRIKIKLGDSQEVILVPQRAVMLGQGGTAQVYVVDSQNIVQPRAVKTGSMEGSLWQIIEGLKTGEKVVVNGTGKLKPGMTVSIKNVEKPNIASNNTDSKQQ
ncbi:efflux RND transporter periplasmic adaptor subunit [Desulfovibrio gilichinskyi]|uniref:Membrane fusion protein, multidrug efflux system/membrane fusion protein, multidrug efflux system n=1 Tax=Desulfovibrio gilichinskyi TaxID=1519643 RepID=A0A1X7EKC1_9BACT|nr:efflux RND transporter periplasmic adaptor subunit [Desulfovibrio gilichinskyi]SMF35336.1 membrane fusion protein, multidrug efflux system/membrane fusion protein, multidrug efflux system [Desulfovibrio gilichinskyi]